MQKTLQDMRTVVNGIIFLVDPMKSRAHSPQVLIALAETPMENKGVCYPYGKEKVEVLSSY